MSKTMPGSAMHPTARTLRAALAIALAWTPQCAGLSCRAETDFAVPPAPPRQAGPASAVPNPERPWPDPVDEELTVEERVNIAVYESAHPSVVHINTRGVYVDEDSFFQFEVPAEGSGSGAVWDQQGHVLTNFHVVEDARQIEVTLHDGKPHAARLIGHDVVNDVAVLQIESPPPHLDPIEPGDSSRLRVGQRVFALGSPFELERTFTTGIISSLNRSLPSRDRRRIMKSIIQVDAAMNPGNSGGPLLDSRGRMIGMNTAIASRTGQNTGVGFAIPIDRIKRIVPDLIRFGKVTRPEIGITSVVMTEHGLLVRSLMPGGPAEQAGLRGIRVVRQRQRQGFLILERQMVDPSAADVIVAVDGQPVRTLDDFLSLVEAKQPGEVVTLTVIREGKAIEVPVTLRAEAG